MHIQSLIKYEDSFVTRFWLTDTLSDIESMGLNGHQMPARPKTTQLRIAEREAGRAEDVACTTAADKAGCL